MRAPAKQSAPPNAETSTRFNPHQFRCNIERDSAGAFIIKDPQGKILTTQEIYLLLSADFPEDVVERTEGGKTGKGYDTTGIKYQAVVDRLNDVLTPWGWSYKVEGLEFAELASRSGTPMTECTVDVTVTIAGQSFTHTGSHRAKSKGDAKKGAVTNALKKTCAMYGVGRQAYLGTLDDDNEPVEEPREARVYRVGSREPSGPSCEVRDTQDDSPRATKEEAEAECPLPEGEGRRWIDVPDPVLTAILQMKEAGDNNKRVAGAVLGYRKFSSVYRAYIAKLGAERVKEIVDPRLKLWGRKHVFEFSEGERATILELLKNIAESGMAV